MSGLTKEQITTVVGGILDVLDMIDHKDWQGEAIQDLRRALEPPTPDMPPDDKRCELMSDDDPPRRCQNPRLIVRHCGNVGQCYFGPESKPAPKPPYIPITSETPEETLARINGPESELGEGELLDIANCLCTYAVHRDNCKRKTDKPTKEQELAGLAVECTCGLRGLRSSVLSFFMRDHTDKPAPKPPPPPENVTTKGVLLRKICPNCDHYVSRCICEPLPASTTCPARVPSYAETDKAWKDYRRAGHPSSNVTLYDIWVAGFRAGFGIEP